MAKPTKKQVKTSRTLDDLSGLTDLGMSKPSMSNSVGSDNPAMDELFSTMPDDVRKLTGPAVSDWAKAEVLKRELAHMKEQPAESTKDNMLTIGSLVKILGAGAAAAFGGPAGLAAALGITTGTVKKAEETAILDNDAHAQAIKAKEAELTDTQEMITKQRERMANILNANPEAYVGPDGTSISPEALGWLVTGADVPLYPGSKTAENQRKDRWDKQWAFISDVVKNAKSPEEAKPVLDAMATMLTDPDSKTPAGLGQALANVIGTPEQESSMASLFLRWGGETGLSALRYAAENKLDYTHPDVIRKLVFKDQDTLQPSQLLNAKQLETIDRVDKWAKENPEQYNTIVDKAVDEGEKNRLIADAVFGAEPGTKQFWVDKMNLPAEFNLAEFMKVYGSVSDEFGLLDVLTAGKNVKAGKTMSPEEIRNFKVNVTDQLQTSIKKNAQDNAVRKSAQWRNQKRLEVMGAIPNLSASTADELLNIAMEEALANSRRADGTINEAELNKQLELLVPQIIKQYNEE